MIYDLGATHILHNTHILASSTPLGRQRIRPPRTIIPLLTLLPRIAIAIAIRNCTISIDIGAERRYAIAQALVLIEHSVGAAVGGYVAYEITLGLREACCGDCNDETEEYVLHCCWWLDFKVGRIV